MIKACFLILVFLISSCGSPSHIKPSARGSSKKKIKSAHLAKIAFNEKTFWNDYDAILKASAKAAYLKNSGQVFYISYINYKKLSSKKSFHKIIKSQLSKLSKTQIPAQTQSLIAFWINTYNFLVISEIVNNYPLKSNKAIRFKSKKHLIAGNHYSLEEIYKILQSLGVESIEKMKVGRKTDLETGLLNYKNSKIIWSFENKFYLKIRQKIFNKSLTQNIAW